MCKYCELEVEEKDEKDGWVSLVGPKVKDYDGCGIASLQITVCGSLENPDDRSAYLFTSYEDDWTVKVPVTIGTSYGKSETHTFEAPTGIDDNSMFKIEFCPFCGRKLV